MNYEIIATLGPTSDAASMWKAMVLSGVSAFRLNTSHLSIAQLHQWLSKIVPFLDSLDEQVPLVLDLQGSKWRLGQFSPFELESGRMLELVCAASSDQEGVLPVPHPDFFLAATLSSGEIVLNDAKSCLAVEEIAPESMIARVTRGGDISPRKGITYTSCAHRTETLNEKDREILAQTRHLDGIRYALSYVRDASEMSGYREIFGDSKYLIAKLERQPALSEAMQIAHVADEMWLCRGDLGAELGLRAMAEAVKKFSDLVGDFPVPIHLAGQVLEHMSGHRSPTRSEVCYLHDALINGYGGCVLSDETAIGQYPLESCRAAALFHTLTNIDM